MYVAPIPAHHALDRLAERIEAEMGLSFSQAKRRDLHNAVRRITESQGFGDEDACIEWLLNGYWDKEKNDACSNHLTIGETYFFREPRAFDLVLDYARKKFGGSGGNKEQLRIWSAGCCTGEEPYSIAMALRQAMPEQDPAAITILATDINARHLRIAQAGVYRQWSFRNTHAASQSANFSEEGDNQFRINDQIRKLVQFSELNLAAPDYPSVANNTHTMDIIFCRNVLMYFSKQQAKKVIERFRQCLVDGGWLIVNPSEASAELFPGFSRVYYPDAIYFQKTSHGSEPTVIHPAKESADVTHSNPRVPATKVEARPKAPRLRKQPCKPEQTPVSGDESPTAEFFHAKALQAIESGDQRNAMQHLKRVVYLNPDFILAHYLMGVLQSAQNKHSEAARQFSVAGELLAALDGDDIVPGSDGLSAAYLQESIRSYMDKAGS